MHLGILSCVAAFMQKTDLRNGTMNNVPLQPVVAILAGILILLRPEFLNYVVAIYLIVIGILGLMGSRRH